MKMSNRIIMVITVVVFLLLPMLLMAQPGRKQVMEGNQLFTQEKYDEANNKYRDALVNNPENPKIHFNIGATQYKKNKYEEAMTDFEKSLAVDDILVQSKAYYNMGNTLFRMGKLPESILAYTQALKLNPDDEDAKYNLELARRKLKEQAQKQNNQQQQQQNQQKQQQEQQQQQQNQQQEEQEKEDQQQEPKQEQSEEEQEQQQQEQAKPEDQKEISREEAERILNALKEDEKDLQKQTRMKSPGKVRVVKDW